MGPLPHGAEKMMENNQKNFPATLGQDRVGFGFFVICGENVGSRASLRSVNVVKLILRPVRPRTRSAALRSAPTECDNLWRPTSQSVVLIG